MSAQPITASGVPVVNEALEPASVRNGSTAVKQAYESALEFEQVLVEQLSKSMTATIGGGESSGEDGSEEQSAESSELSSTLPQALSAGIMNAGGLGLAAQLAHSLESEQTGAASTPAAAAPAATPPAASAGGSEATTATTLTGGVSA